MTQLSKELMAQFKGYRYIFTLNDMAPLMLKQVFTEASIYAQEKILIKYLSELTGKTADELATEFDAYFDKRFSEGYAELVAKYAEKK